MYDHFCFGIRGSLSRAAAAAASHSESMIHQCFERGILSIVLLLPFFRCVAEPVDQGLVQRTTVRNVWSKGHEMQSIGNGLQQLQQSFSFPPTANATFEILGADKTAASLRNGTIFTPGLGRKIYF